MNGNKTTVEIFAPFGEAYEWMKQILFQPFNLEKWLVIGFAAFLSHLAGGGGGFNYKRGANHSEWNFHSTSYRSAASSHHLFPLWALLAGVILVPLALALVALFLWLGARGKFIFTDCIVRNRAAIQEPWREFRSEANSLFLFMILAALLFLAIITAAALPMILRAFIPGSVAVAAFAGVDLFLTIAIGVVLAVIWGIAAQLMVPIMYRQRCRALVAFREVLSLIGENPGAIILFVLFLFVISIAVGLAACLLTCMTCCITAIPYVGTVIFLPIFVWLTAFTLFFLRQFGERYDAWSGLPRLEISAPSAAQPPAPPTQI